MTEPTFFNALINGIVDYAQTMHWAEAASVCFGIAYLVLAMRQHIACWPAALISTALGVYVFGDVSLPMEAALHAYYFAMAIFGWWMWSQGKQNDGHKDAAGDLPIQRWPLTYHLAAIGIIIALTLISGHFIPKFIKADMPYLDAFTTWGAVITTYMVTKKILSNWVYWVVIDSLAIYLYLQKDLYLYAAQMAVYVVMACIGWIQWQRAYSEQSRDSLA